MGLSNLYDVCQYSRNPELNLSDIDEIVLMMMYIYKIGDTILCKVAHSIDDDDNSD
jgi:hypothetical protein